MQESQFFTWEALSAMGGASLLTFFIVQYTKSLIDRFWQIPTDIFAVMVAFFVLLAAQFATGSSVTDWRVYALTFANSFLVAAAAAQMQQKSISPPTRKGKRNDTDTH
ncbi:hypothetical protein AV654_17825 [Paenibacillus elgii]|uniref:Holin n=1 Tax=Paenibacillus elgii TaxID=189691 RepID=A0A163YF48_9BACL|nr:hypothetical protein [Paenibacillus elgii]KZE79328.1 hypothetical protein AV654_17825 [Paenibacillus elgii]